MTILERLKFELANKEYLTDDEYKQFLTENEFFVHGMYSQQVILLEIWYEKWYMKFVK